MRTITRRQLKDLGLSDYLALAVTKEAEVVGKQGRSNVYKLEDVIYCIETKLNSKRIKAITKASLQAILAVIDEDNVEVKSSHLKDFQTMWDDAWDKAYCVRAEIDWKSKMLKEDLEDKVYSAHEKIQWIMNRVSHYKNEKVAA